MCQEAPDIDVTRRGTAVLLTRVVNDRDQPVTVLADIEDHVPIHIVGILEDLPHFHEVPPTRLGSDPVPGSNLLGRIRILLFGLGEVLACDNVHVGLSAVPPQEFSAAVVVSLRVLCKMKSCQEEYFHFAKFYSQKPGFNPRTGSRGIVGGWPRSLSVTDS